jgi:hypothetical protein
MKERGYYIDWLRVIATLAVFGMRSKKKSSAVSAPRPEKTAV